MTAAKKAAKAKVEKKETAEDKAAKAAELNAKRAEIETEFREDMVKAQDKRKKALDKLPALPGEVSGNVAEQAWNETKADDDPEYGACAAEHRQKLDTAVEHIRRTGNADIAGLEDFEEKVKELLAEEGITPGSEAALIPANTPGRPAES